MPGADPALGPTTYTARMLLDKSYPASEASPPAHAGSPETRSAGSCFDTFRLVAADRAADCPDGEMAPVPGADPALGPTTYTACMLLDKSYPANEAYPPAPDGSLETCSTSCCSEAGDSCVAAAFGTGAVSKSLPAVRVSGGPAWAGGEAIIYIEWLPEALLQVIICRLGVAAFELACTSRLYLVEVRMAQDEGRLSKSKISRALIDAGFPAVMANCSEGTAARRHMVEAGRPGPGPSALFWTGWIRGSRTSTHHRRAIDMFEVIAILYWLWKQRRRVRLMLMRWLSRTGKAAGQANATARLHYMTRLPEGMDRGLTYGRAKEDLRSAAAELLAMARYRAGQLYVKWSIPHPWLPAAVAKQLQGVVPKEAGSPRARHYVGASSGAGDSTPSYEALRCAARNAGSVPSACSTSPAEQVATIDMANAFWQLPLAEGQSKDWQLPRVEGRSKDINHPGANSCGGGSLARRAQRGQHEARRVSHRTERRINRRAAATHAPSALEGGVTSAHPQVESGSAPQLGAGGTASKELGVSPASDTASPAVEYSGTIACPLVASGGTSYLGTSGSALGGSGTTAYPQVESSSAPQLGAGGTASKALGVSPASDTASSALEYSGTIACSLVASSSTSQLGTSGTARKAPGVSATAGRALDETAPEADKRPGALSQAVTQLYGIEQIPEVLRQEIIHQLGVAAFEFACTCRLHLTETRSAQDEGRLSKSKISRALINEGFPAILANYGEEAASRLSQVNAGTPGPGRSVLFTYGGTADFRMSNPRASTVNTYEWQAILYWQWRQRCIMRRMMVLWLSRTRVRGMGLMDAFAGFYDMTYRDVEVDNRAYGRGRVDVRSSAVYLLAEARRCTKQLYEVWRIPRPWQAAAVAKHLLGAILVPARCLPAPELRRKARQPVEAPGVAAQPASKLAKPDCAHRTAAELRCPVKSMTGHQQGARCAEDLEVSAPPNGCLPRTDHAATRAPSSRSHISPSELPLEVANGCGLGGNLGAIAPVMNAAETRVAEGGTRQATPHSLARVVRLKPPRDCSMEAIEALVRESPRKPVAAAAPESGRKGASTHRPGSRRRGHAGKDRGKDLPLGGSRVQVAGDAERRSPKHVKLGQNTATLAERPPNSRRMIFLTSEEDRGHLRRCLSNIQRSWECTEPSNTKRSCAEGTQTGETEALVPIFIKGLTCGKSFSVEVLPSATVKAVKDAIEKTRGIPAQMQRLVYGGHPLDDGNQILHHGIGRDSTLHLVTALHGGMIMGSDEEGNANPAPASISSVEVAPLVDAGSSTARWVSLNLIERDLAPVPDVTLLNSLVHQQGTDRVLESVVIEDSWNLMRLRQAIIEQTLHLGILGLTLGQWLFCAERRAIPRRTESGCIWKAEALLWRHAEPNHVLLLLDIKAVVEAPPRRSLAFPPGGPRSVNQGRHVGVVAVHVTHDGAATESGAASCGEIQSNKRGRFVRSMPEAGASSSSAVEDLVEDDGASLSSGALSSAGTQAGLAAAARMHEVPRWPVCANVVKVEIHPPDNAPVIRTLPCGADTEVIDTGSPVQWLKCTMCGHCSRIFPELLHSEPPRSPPCSPPGSPECGYLVLPHAPSTPPLPSPATQRPPVPTGAAASPVRDPVHAHAPVRTAKSPSAIAAIPSLLLPPSQLDPLPAAAAARSLIEGKLQLGGRVTKESVQGVTDYSHSKPVSWGDAVVSVVEHPEVIPQGLRDPIVEARRPPFGGVAHLTSFSEVARLDAGGREPGRTRPTTCRPTPHPAPYRGQAMAEYLGHMRWLQPGAPAGGCPHPMWTCDCGETTGYLCICFVPEPQYCGCWGPIPAPAAGAQLCTVHPGTATGPPVGTDDRLSIRA